MRNFMLCLQMWTLTNKTTVAGNDKLEQIRYDYMQYGSNSDTVIINTITEGFDYHK